MLRIGIEFDYFCIHNRHYRIKLKSYNIGTIAVL